MLRHTNNEPKDYTHGTASTTYMPIARTDEMSEAHIEDYLDHAVAPLVGSVSYEQRQAERTRLQIELGAIIAAYVELGHERPEAVALTLRNRLLPVDVNTPVAHSSRAEEANASDTPLAFLRLMAVTGGGFISAVVIGRFLDRDHILAGGLVILLCLFMPLLGGVWAGVCSKEEKPIKSLFKACAGLFVPVLLLWWSWDALRHRYYGREADYDGSVLLVLCILVLCFVGGLIGIAMRKKEPFRRQSGK